MGVHDGHRERLKARYLEHGLDNFNDINVLELLLFYAIPRADTNLIAHELLNRFGSLSGVLEASIQELQESYSADLTPVYDRQVEAAEEDKQRLRGGEVFHADIHV